MTGHHFRCFWWLMIQFYTFLFLFIFSWKNVFGRLETQSYGIKWHENKNKGGKSNHFWCFCWLMIPFFPLFDENISSSKHFFINQQNHQKWCDVIPPTRQLFWFFIVFRYGSGSSWDEIINNTNKYYGLISHIWMSVVVWLYYVW